jgi:hypothetical protein
MTFGDALLLAPAVIAAECGSCVAPMAVALLAPRALLASDYTHTP